MPAEQSRCGPLAMRLLGLLDAASGFGGFRLRPQSPSAAASCASIILLFDRMTTILSSRPVPRTPARAVTVHRSSGHGLGRTRGIRPVHGHRLAHPAEASLGPPGAINSGRTLADHQLPAPRQRTARSGSDPRSGAQGPRNRWDPWQAHTAALDVMPQQRPPRRAQWSLGIPCRFACRRVPIYPARDGLIGHEAVFDV